MISEAFVEDDEIAELGEVAIDETLPGTLMPEAELIDKDDTDDSGFDAIDETIVGTLVAAAALADELERDDYEPTPVDPADVDEDIAEVVELVETEAEDDSEAEGDDLDWLDTLDEANVTGWLMAEQALLAEEKDSRDDFTQPTFDVPTEPVTDRSQESTTPEQFFSTYQFDDRGIPELATAQSALKLGQLSAAHDAYSALIDSGESLPYVITDLETVAEVTDSRPDFMKLLGDAYSRNGQLQKAIEIYRLALDNL
jgi:tetratricopeptide (TPR) repeat protein